MTNNTTSQPPPPSTQPTRPHVHWTPEDAEEWATVPRSRARVVQTEAFRRFSKEWKMPSVFPMRAGCADGTAKDRRSTSRTSSLLVQVDDAGDESDKAADQTQQEDSKLPVLMSGVEEYMGDDAEYYEFAMGPAERYTTGRARVVTMEMVRATRESLRFRAVTSQMETGAYDGGVRKEARNALTLPLDLAYEVQYDDMEDNDEEIVDLRRVRIENPKIRNSLMQKALLNDEEKKQKENAKVHAITPVAVQEWLGLQLENRI